MDRNIHRFNFERLERMEEANAKGLDRLLEIIGTGTFGLSIALITGFGPDTLIQPWWIIWSWIFFGLAILVHIFAYVYAIHRLGLAKDRLLKTPVDEPDTRSTEERESDERKAKRFLLTNDVLRYIVLVLMMLGMCTLVVFTSYNLLNKSERTQLMEDSTHSPEVDLKG